MLSTVSTKINNNNLEEFKKYLDDENSNINEYINAIQYSYNLDLNIYTQDDEGNILYKETITSKIIGIGHFEPLRHYAEVHVRLEPLKDKERIEIASEVSQDELSAAWQKQILSSLHKIHHKGVLTGSMLTGVKIILTAGKGHLKHTEGQDFYQASKRAVRQALKKAENILIR